MGLFIKALQKPIECRLGIISLRAAEQKLSKSATQATV